MTLLFELLEYIWEHPGEITLNAVLLLLLRKFIMSEVHKLLHLGRDGELKWILQKVEVLTGEKYDGQQDFSKIVRSRYIAKSFFYLRKGTKSAYQLRRTKRMQNINRSWVIAVLIFIGAEINKRYGVQLPDGWENLAYNLIQGAALIGAMIFNAFHHKPQPIEVTKAIQDAPHNYAEMVPIINDVNQSLNQIHEKLKTGRYDDATKEAIDAYMKVHDLLQKKGA